MLRRYRFAVVLAVLTALVVETLVLVPAHHHSAADRAACHAHGDAAGAWAEHTAVHRHCSSHGAVERPAAVGGIATALRDERSPCESAGAHSNSCAVCRFLAQLVAPVLDDSACTTASVFQRDSELPTLVVGTAPHSLPQPRSPPQGV